MTTKTNIGSALSLHDALPIFGIAPSSYSNYEHGRSYPDIRLIFRTAVYYHINIEFLIFLVCIDLASFENLKNEELFRLFTYGHTFSWDFFELFERYNSLSDVYKHAASTFLEAASICNQQI